VYAHFDSFQGDETIADHVVESGEDGFDLSLVSTDSMKMGRSSERRRM